MRNGQNKRMRGRNRNGKPHHSGGGGGSSGGSGGGGGGGHHHNPLTRVYESNGQEVKIRGTAHTIAEKYLQLARDATTSGDYVTAENHFQHAEHYLRLIATAQEQFRQQNPYYQPQQAMPGTEANSDGSFEDGEEDGQQPTQGQPSQGQPSQGQPVQAQQPNYGSNQQNFGNQQPNYQPREQQQPTFAQPRQHQPNYNNNQQPSYQPQQIPQPQPQPQPVVSVEGDAGGLPSFITGGQPQPASLGQNGHDNNQSGDRFPRHRRRRHRGPGEPRPDGQDGAQNFQGDSGSDGPAT